MRVGLGATERRRSMHDIKVPRERIESMWSRHYNIDQWDPSALCSSLGALMLYNDRSACAVPLH